LLLLPLIGLPLLLMCWLINDRLTTSLRQSHFDQAETLLDEVSLMVNAELATAEANLEFYSRSELLKQYLVADEEDRFGLWQRPLLELFSGYVKSYPNYYEIRVLRPDGFEETRYSSHHAPNLSEEEGESPWFQELRTAESHYLAPCLDPNTGIQSFLIAKPIALANPAVSGDRTPSLRGYLAITLRPTLIEEQILRGRLGRQGRIMVVDDRGHPLFHPPVTTPTCPGPGETIGRCAVGDAPEKLWGGAPLPATEPAAPGPEPGGTAARPRTGRRHPQRHSTGGHRHPYQHSGHRGTLLSVPRLHPDPADSQDGAGGATGGRG